MRQSFAYESFVHDSTLRAGRIKCPSQTPAPASPETAINPHQTPQPLLNSPLHLLRRALQAYTSQWQAAVGEITPPQYAVLITLGETPGIDQSTLGEAAGIDLATLAHLVNRMEQRGLLTRRVDPDSRRRKLLTLTEDGTRTLERIGPVSDAVNQDVLGGLSPQEHAALLHALRLISDPDNH